MMTIIQTVTGGLRESNVDIDEGEVVGNTEDVRSHRIAGDRFQFLHANVAGDTDHQ